jgi:serine/threonine protein kinase
MSLEAGATLSHYRLISKIGEGGMGVVWKALDTTITMEFVPGEDWHNARKSEKRESPTASLRSSLWAPPQSRLLRNRSEARASTPRP